MDPTDFSAAPDFSTPEAQRSILSALSRLAAETGLKIVEAQANLGDVRTKSDGTPVTSADLNADAEVRAGLGLLAPGIPIISEESPIPDYSVRKDWPRFWLVDALDGTKEFLAGRDEFTVNIALIAGGIPVLGVVYAPKMDLLYYAGQAIGSWRRKAGEQESRRIFSRAPAPDDEIVIVESRSHPSEKLEAYLKTINLGRRIKVGSSVKFGLIADGTAHVYPRFGRTNEWDVGAGDCVFRYSGRDCPRSSPLKYNKKELASGDFVLGLEP